MRASLPSASLDLSRAQLEPMRAFHFFHESLNISTKIAIASSVVLAKEAALGGDGRELGRIIRSSHPAWNSPPVHEFTVELQKDIYRSTSAFAIVSVFSAFDDFIEGLEIDCGRVGVTKRDSKGASDDGGEVDKIFSFYRRWGWDVNDINGFEPVLKYFRFIRNCIAHRSSRASAALSTHSRSISFQGSVRPYLDGSLESAPSFAPDEAIFIEPGLAIACSDLLRKIAVVCNKRLISTLGEGDFLRLVVGNIVDGRVGGRFVDLNEPLPLVNSVLVSRYRVGVPLKHNIAPLLKSLNLWAGLRKHLGC